MSDSPASMRGLLDLPPELHDHIWSYLDWDRTKDLLPERKDIFTLSITCKRLRKNVIPTLFRHVTLRIHWAQDVLLEPTLFRLRKDLPHLARHVQTVAIKAQYEMSNRALNWDYLSLYEADEIRDAWNKYKLRCESETPVFVTSASPDEWLNPSRSEAAKDQPSPRHTERVQELYADITSRFGVANPEITWISGLQAERKRLHFDTERQRFCSTLADVFLDNSVGARRSTDELSDDIDRAGGSANTHLSRRNGSARLRLELHALAFAASCIPSTVTRLIVHSVPDANAHTGAMQNFALATAAAAMRMLSPGLAELSIDTADPEPSSRHRPSYTVSETAHFTIETAECLSRLKTLRLHIHAHVRLPLQRKLEPWTRVAIEHLELWNCHVGLNVPLDLLAAMPTLKGLHLRKLVVPLESAGRRRQSVRAGGFITSIVTADSTHLAAFQSTTTSDDFDRDDPSVTYLLHFAMGKLLLNPTNGLPFCSRLYVSKINTAVTDVREALPNTVLSLDLGAYTTPGALAFIHTNVANVAERLSEERRQRLLQDFKYFAPMWKAEADAGSRDGDEKQFATLVDAAMAARSQYQWS